VVDALLVEGNERGARPVPRAQSAQALVELALALPVVLALLLYAVFLGGLFARRTTTPPNPTLHWERLP